MIDIAAIWHDAAHGGPPALVRRKTGDLLLRLVFAKNNRDLIRASGKAGWLLRWDKQGRYWSAPRSWFEALATGLIERHGCAWIIQEAEELKPCAAACMHARGLDCVCGCGGKNHGLGDPDGWAHGVADSDVVEWRGKQYTCRFFRPHDAATFVERLRGSEAVTGPPPGLSAP